MERDVIRIIILEDHEITRLGLIDNLNSLVNVKVIAAATNANELFDLLDINECDIVLTDIELPDINGIEVTKIVLSKYPNLIISAFSSHGDELHLQSMIEAGGKGFILKSVIRKELEKAVNILYNGGCYYSKELLPFFIYKFITKNKNPKTKFTDIEFEVLMLIAKGFSNEEIAEKLSIEPQKVNTHISRLLEKTHTKIVFDLLVYAIINDMANDKLIEKYKSLN